MSDDYVWGADDTDIETARFDAAEEFGLHGRPLERFFFGKISHFDLPMQADGAFWADSDVRAAVDDRHRVDLTYLARAVQDALAHLTTLPAGVCHGDAAPDIFRESGDGTVVTLDWSSGHVGEVRTDLLRRWAALARFGIDLALDVTRV